MNKNFKQKQTGFTLIELVVVIVILGILAATALPKFVNMSKEAREAAVKGAAGAVTSAAAIQYAKSALTGTATYPAGTAITGFVDVTGLGTPTTTATSAVWNAPGATTASSCNVSYDSTTGIATANTGDCS